jgi:hypothetical protein
MDALGFQFRWTTGWALFSTVGQTIGFCRLSTGRAFAE